MKRFIALLMIISLAMPVATAWLPHDVSHKIHNQLAQPHESDIAASIHHDSDAPASDHHQLHLDILSYFDHLHIDLKKADNLDLQAPLLSVHDMQYCALLCDAPQVSSLSLANRSQGPPPLEWQVASSYGPVYLATSRLRI